MKGDSMPLETRTLENGLRYRVTDQTVRYFGDYHHVRLVTTFSFDVDKEILPEGETLDGVQRLVGHTISFERVLSRMGVPTADLDTVKRQLIDNFLTTSVPYLSHPDYLRNHLRRVLDDRRRRISIR
jgi:hypothetical protein